MKLHSRKTTVPVMSHVLHFAADRDGESMGPDGHADVLYLLGKQTRCGVL